MDQWMAQQYPGQLHDSIFDVDLLKNASPAVVTKNVAVIARILGLPDSRDLLVG
jgi:hypothetical protein